MAIADGEQGDIFIGILIFENNTNYHYTPDHNDVDGIINMNLLAIFTGPGRTYFHYSEPQSLGIPLLEASKTTAEDYLLNTLQRPEEILNRIVCLIICETKQSWKFKRQNIVTSLQISVDCVTNIVDSQLDHDEN